MLSRERSIFAKVAWDKKATFWWILTLFAIWIPSAANRVFGVALMPSWYWWTALYSSGFVTISFVLYLVLRYAVKLENDAATKQGSLTAAQSEIDRLKNPIQSIEIGDVESSIDPTYYKFPVTNTGNVDITNGIAYIESLRRLGQSSGELLANGRIAIPTESQLNIRKENPSYNVGRFNLDRGDTKRVIPFELRDDGNGGNHTIHIQAEAYSDLFRHVYALGNGFRFRFSFNPGQQTRTYEITPATLPSLGIVMRRVADKDG